MRISRPASSSVHDARLLLITIRNLGRIHLIKPSSLRLRLSSSNVMGRIRRERDTHHHPRLFRAAVAVPAVTSGFLSSALPGVALAAAAAGVDVDCYAEEEGDEEEYAEDEAYDC
jgi:hypothetical protein